MSETSVTLYYAHWCGHCQVFKPEWAKLEKNVEEHNKKVGKGIIKCVSKEDSQMTEADKAKISGFPTIVITKNGKSYTYQGERKADQIMRELLGSVDYTQLQKVQEGGRRSKTHSHYGKKNSDEYYKMKYLKYKAKYLGFRSRH